MNFSCVPFSLLARDTVKFYFVRYFLFFFKQELALLSHRSNLKARLILLAKYTSRCDFKNVVSSPRSLLRDKSRVLESGVGYGLTVQ